MKLKKPSLTNLLPSRRLGGSLGHVFSLMKEDKLYSAMYILGTAIAIAFTMLIAEIYYIKVADIAPEVNRSKMYILSHYQITEESGGRQSFSPHEFTKDNYFELFKKMKSPECVCAELPDNYSGHDHYMKLPDGFHDQKVSIRLVDPDYFQFFHFNFIQGVPFTQDDFDNARPLVVITEEISQKLFGKGKKAMGKTLRMDNKEYRICGVIETPSVLAENCTADIWFPFSLEGVVNYWHYPVWMYFSVPKAKREAFMQELKGVQARFNSMEEENPIQNIQNDVEKYTDHTLKYMSYLFNTGLGTDNIFGTFAIVIMLLLLVPALNLCGMVASRMNRRLPEMAIRKAFGAKRRTLLGQVIMENLTLTLIGGAVGLCLAWAALYGWRDWVFHAFDFLKAKYGQVPIIKGEMFFGPAIFLVALLVSTILNVLAAALPAWLSLRKPIVESMMTKK